MNHFFAPFDTETGGLDPETSDLLTLYMCILDEEFKMCDELYLKLKPDNGRYPIAEAGALNVNKIDLRTHLEDPQTVTYSEGKRLLQTMLSKYSKKVGRGTNIRPLGYNVPFDLKYTHKHLMSEKEWNALMHYQYVDVMQRVNFLKESGWFPADVGSLVASVEYLQIPQRAAHNAKEDTLMTVDVFRKLLEIMKSKKEGGGSTQDLIALLEAE